jgi:hypothetical protein
MMAAEIDLFTQINNSILDLQAAQFNSIGRPLKRLSTLLHHSDLSALTDRLIAGVDYDAFMDESERTTSGMGGGQLLWPDDTEKAFGLTLVMIDRLAQDPDQILNIVHTFFYTSSNVQSGINAFIRQVIIPFGRDYKAYVLSQGNADPRLILPTSNKVFIVHGHDEAAKESLARFLEKAGLEAIVLSEQPNQGRTIIEKFEDCAKEVGFAVVLLTPDDLGGSLRDDGQTSRARQNVVFELGWFAGKLGRGRVCLLRKGNVEIPSDLYGVVYTDMDAGGGWRGRLVAELKAARLEFDANRIWQ